MAATKYGDISPRTAAYVNRDLLRVGLPYLIFEKFGQTHVLPMNNTKSMEFRRYEALDNDPKTLVEGVTPTDTQQLTETDILVTLDQYYDGVQLTDIVLDTHEDPVLQVAIERLGESVAQMIEKVRFGVLRAGSNVYYANGAGRSAVNTAISRSMQRRVIRGLKRQHASQFTKIVRSTPSWGTVAVQPAFVAVAHPDLESSIRDMTGFKDVIDYGAVSPWENEIGAVEGVRYLLSTVVEPWANAGGLDNDAVLSSAGTNADVYPILYFARDAYAIVPLKGRHAITPMVTNPKPTDSDPWAQRGWVTIKTMQNAVILNDLWCARVECGAPV